MPRIAFSLAVLITAACFAEPTTDADDDAGDDAGDDAESSTGAPSESGESTGSPLEIPDECVDIGVLECDVYVQLYVECIDEKLPEENKDTSLSALVTSCEAWTETAQDPSMAEDLAEMCVTAYDAVKASCGFE